MFASTLSPYLRSVFDMWYDVINAVGEPGPEEHRWLRELEGAATALLEAAGFEPGLGEALDFVAGDVVAVALGNPTEESVAGCLQAFAAPASSYIPPLEQFLPLARDVLALVRRMAPPDAF